MEPTITFICLSQAMLRGLILTNRSSRGIVYCLAIDAGLITTWWRHQKETFSALLALCVGNSPVTGEFPAQRPVTRSFDIFFDLRLNKWFSKQWWGWWFETLSRPLWRHCNAPHGGALLLKCLQCALFVPLTHSSQPVTLMSRNISELCNLGVIYFHINNRHDIATN